MLNFHPLRVAAVERIAQDAICMTLEIPPALREHFQHDAGQYLTLRRDIDGREERRTYSIVTPPGSSVLKLGVREQQGGRMSRVLAELVAPGDMIEVGTPIGRFRTSIDPARSRSYVAFVAGSGITPVLSLATDILSREPKSRFTLVYGNRSTARTMFLEETLALKNRFLDRFSVHFVMSREPQQAVLMNGRIDAAKVEELARRFVDIGSADEYFVCGPGAMTDQVKEALKRLNGHAAVRLERFASASARAVHAPPEPAAIPDAQTTPTAILATVSILMDGRQRSFPMMREDASVLDAAERAGLDLPFSCRSGICATCRTRIVGGAATMSHNIALEPWEVDAGFVLCCQARPTTPALDLTYDEK